MTEEARAYELVKPKPSEALIEVEQQRAIAETQGAMIIAKRFPRDMIAAMDRIVNACTRPGLAEAALYEYSRGGTAITGPSIRLAEAIAQSWGNLQFGIRELEQRAGVSTVEAFAWDIETNVREVKIFQVTHKRYTKKGTYALEDPRDIYEMVANQGARRLRACILGIIPGDVVETAVKQCDTTLKTKAAVTPERIASLLEKFGEFNVTKEQIEKRIQRHVDAMTPAQMVNLGKIYNSLKDGMSSPADWFEVQEGKAQEEAKDKMDSLKDKLRGEPDAKPQSPPENAATTAPGSGDGKEAHPPETTQPPETKPPKAKTLFENLMAARGTFCHMVLDNGDLIQNLLPDELRAVKERWTKASAQGIGGITKGEPWPIQEPKEEKPLFEIEEKKADPLADPFLAKVEEYRKEIEDPKAWEQVLRVSGITHTGVSSIPEGEPRIRFLERCSRTLDQRNAKKNKAS